MSTTQSDLSTRLMNWRNPDGGWPYVSGAGSATEPTAMAVLAGLAGGVPASDLAGSANWLLARGLGDGSFAAAAEDGEPTWCTPTVAMALRALGHDAPAQQAADWLESAPVFTFNAALTPGQYGYDTTIPGWPWTAGDFSFVEPTALAVIFLKQMGRVGAARVQQAVQMLRGRALAAGGWNYGEPQVLGGDLFPTVAPTALALLALADEQDQSTDAALQWLLNQRGQISSLFSLGWAGVALNVLGYMDGAWQADVATQAVDSSSRVGPLELSLAMLSLLGQGGHPFAFAK